MAFTTKLNLINQKFEQTISGTLTLSGTTNIASTGKLEYLTDKSSYFDVTPRAIPDVAYVTGRTADLSADIQYISGKTSENIADIANLATWSGETTADIAFVSAATAANTADIANLATWSGQTTADIAANTADIAVLAAWSGETTADIAFVSAATAANTADIAVLAAWSGDTTADIAANTADIAALGAISGITLVSITGVTNGLTKVGDHSAKLGGALTETTTLFGSEIFNVNVNKINLTGLTSGVTFGGDVFVRDLIGANTLVCVNPTTGLLGTTSLSAFGGITGGTNGIVEFPNYRLGLGGALTQDTAISGAGFDLCLGTDASCLATLQVFTTENITVESDANLVMSLSGGTIATSDLKGLRYTTDYSSTFVDSSLVTKCYVDTVATGLQPHAAACVATTADITLDNTTTSVDGITLVNGWRVLVKDQTDTTENGIYIVNTAGAWTRADDYNYAPTGEIQAGDLIPVLTGATQAATIWIETAPDPITGETNPITFAQFSKFINVVAGDGIDIAPAGANQTISVDLYATGGLAICDVNNELAIALDTNSGLVLGAGGLSVNSSIAGNALDWNAGVIDVNVTDISTQLGGVLTGSTNGLTDLNGVVCLGGTLTTPTTISGNDSNTLTYTDTAATNKRGILYGGDYSSTYVARSLVDAAYVTGLTNGLDGRVDVIEAQYVTGATNGLVKSGAHLVKLGGSLCENTTILNPSYAYCVSGSSAGSTVTTYCEMSGSLSGWTKYCQTSRAITLYGYDCVSGGESMIEINPDTLITCIKASHSGEIHIGGSSSTTCLTSPVICANSLEIDMTSTDGIYLNTAGSQVEVIPSMVQIISLNDQLDVTTGGTTFRSGNDSQGIKYFTDYSATFVDRSLVDKAYVDGLVATSGVTASNGLTAVGNDVQLGGTLTEHTYIGMGNRTLTISGGTDPAYVKVSSSGTGGVEIGANDIYFAVGSGSGLVMYSGATTIQIIQDKIELTGTVDLVNAPATGTTSDWVLVRASDGTVKQIDPANLGEDNNDYGKAIVTTSTGLTTSSPYVILVNHTAPVTITLPDTPFDGQAFKIKDAANDALTNNITIVSNSDNIDRQASNAVINTDSGALELVYDSTLGWFTLAFVN